MKPDYQKPIELVFLEVTRYLLEHEDKDKLGPYSSFSVSTEGGGLPRTAPSWLLDFSRQSTSISHDPIMFAITNRYDSNEVDYGQRSVSFQSQNRVLAITGLVLDTIEAVFELKSDETLLLDQIAESEILTQQALNKEIPLNDPRCCFMRLKRSTDIFQVFSCQNDKNTLASSLRQGFELLTSRVERPSGEGTASRHETSLHWFMDSVLPGIFFFVTNMGFVGLTRASVRKDDTVSLIFGEQVPIVLRSQGSFYNMLGKANVSGVMNDEMTGDMYRSGLVEKTTFLIR